MYFKIGFALPTILITSLIMLTVLLVSVTSTSSVRVSLKAQNYNDDASLTAQSGLKYAQACLSVNNGISRWTNSKPLRPDTDCTGTQLASCPTSPADADCHFVSVNNNVRTTFSVGIDQSPSPSSWKKVSASISHTCGITSFDSVYCWGLNENGQLGNDSTNNSFIPVAVDVSSGLSGKTVAEISSGFYHTCALTSDNIVYCWGDNTHGQLGNDSTEQSDVPVSINMGAMVGKTVAKISSGTYHTCAVTSDGKAYCWGYNGDGELGNSSNTESHIPVAVVNPLAAKTVRSIKAGAFHTCADTTDNLAYCWGYNGYGQMGNNSTNPSNVPVQVLGIGGSGNLTNVSSISSGAYHTCAVVSSAAVCWGYNDYGQIGDTTTVQKNVPTAVSVAGVLGGKTITDISAGYYHTCAIGSNLPYCWGYNADGELGNNLTGNSSVPVAVDATAALSGKTVSAVSTGTYHACVLASDNEIYCWGQDSYGQLGSNETSGSLVPVSLNVDGVKVKDIVSTGTISLLRSDGSVWRSYKQTTRLSIADLIAINQLTSSIVSTGGMHSCAIASDNTPYCWGHNGYGQLGNGTNTQSKVPVAVKTTGVLNGKTITRISAGDVHTCAVADGKAYCWGYNGDGELGNNSTTSSNEPVEVYTDVGGALNGKTVTDIVASYRQTCAIATDGSGGKAYCWGLNDHGQLGNNSTSPSNVPVAVDATGLLNAKTINDIDAGAYHGCVIASDNNSYCWGYNAYGQLGNNLYDESHVPVAVSASGVLSGKTITSIKTGIYHSCAVASDSKAYCWGYNANGQLGDGSTIVCNPYLPGVYCSLVPVAVSTSGVLQNKTIASISDGYYHTCAVSSDGNLYCWGLNDRGQLGNNSTSNSGVPVFIGNLSVISGREMMTVEGGQSHTCAISSVNLVYCWGSNDNGQVGDNSLSQRNVPVSTNIVSKYSSFKGF